MLRRLATAIFPAAVLLAALSIAPALAADAKPHRIAIQIDQNDPRVVRP
jgi:hypothetical protein